jgi:leucyl-tRNA synthetase
MIRLDGTKMSKSKGNLVAPEKYYDTVGADGLRLFHLFVGPPQDDVDWTSQTEEVIDGCARFIDRLYRLAHLDEVTLHEGATDADLAVTVAVHRTVARVTSDIDRWSFNTAVAGLMELLNTVSKQARSTDGIERATLDFAVDTLVKLLAPMAPHISAELWEERYPDSPQVHLLAWPEADPAMLEADTVTMVVQVNGKLKARLDVSPSISEADATARALADPAIAEALAGASPRRVVSVPPRMVNIIL